MLWTHTEHHIHPSNGDRTSSSTLHRLCTCDTVWHAASSSIHSTITKGSISDPYPRRKQQTPEARDTPNHEANFKTPTYYALQLRLHSSGHSTPASAGFKHFLFPVDYNSLSLYRSTGNDSLLSGIVWAFLEFLCRNYQRALSPEITIEADTLQFGSPVIISATALVQALVLWNAPGKIPRGVVVPDVLGCGNRFTVVFGQSRSIMGPKRYEAVVSVFLRLPGDTYKEKPCTTVTLPLISSTMRVQDLITILEDNLRKDVDFRCAQCVLEQKAGWDTMTIEPKYKIGLRYNDCPVNDATSLAEGMLLRGVVGKG